MKTLLLALLLSFNIFAQGEFIIILQGSGTGGTNRDSVPTQFTFTDSTGAAVSTQIISLPIVPTDFDSAGVYVVGGDYKIGALGSITRLVTTMHLGDSLFAVDTTSASASTTTNVAFTIGTVVDTFSTTTVASSFARTDLSPALLLVHSDSVTAGGTGTVVNWKGSGWTFSDADTSTTKVTQTDSSIYLISDGLRTTTTTNKPFDFGLGDFTVEMWLWMDNNTSVKRFLQNTAGGAPGWYAQSLNATANNRIQFRFNNAAADTVGEISTTTGAGDLSNQWVHVVFRFDRNVGADIFINDVLNVSETTEWTNLALTNFTTGAYMYISGWTGGHHLALVATYKSAVSDENIGNLYGLGRP